MNLIERMLRNIGPVRLTAIFVVMLSIAAFFFYLITRTSNPTMELLFSELSHDDVSHIVSRLDAMGVTSEVKAGGTQIWAPAEKIARLRMSLAENGLPASGNAGYEIFDKSDVLGTSNAMMNINYVRALEGELGKSVQSIAGVKSARVHLVLPKRELFSRQQNEPSASVFIKMAGGGRLTKNQVQSIQHLVASAVPKLNSQKISVIDDKGTLLAKGRDSDDASANIDQHQEARVAHENRLVQVIENLLTSSLGEGKIRAEVNADMDFDTITVNSEEYNPDGQVLRSSSTASEDSDSKEASGGQNVSIQNTLPDAGASGGEAGKNTNKSKRTEETMNYEISKTTKTQVKQIGAVKKLSVAVLVDGIYSQGKDGKASYKPRDQKELDQIKSLVKTSVGFDEKRGDAVEVINMQFTPLEALGAVEEPGLATSLLDRLNLSQAIELTVLAIVGLLVLLMVVRPLLIKMIEKAQPLGIESSESEGSFASAGGGISGGTPALTGPGEPRLLESNESSASADGTQGNMKNSALKKMEEIIDRHPEEAVSIIRSWMSSDKA